MVMMRNNYSTLSEAMLSLKNRGYLIDFNLLSKDKAIKRSIYSNDPFKIVRVYRFEGNSDPDGEAVLYVLKSRSGLKGFLTNGYGISSDTETEDILDTISNKT